MKIEISEAVVREIALRVAHETVKAVREVTDAEDENELIGSLVSANLSLKEKVLRYLRQTRHGAHFTKGTRHVTVRSEYLRKRFHLNFTEIQSVREALIADGVLSISKKTPIELTYGQKA